MARADEDAEAAPVGRGTSRRRTVRDRLKALGPGLVTGASDDDPSGVATYSQAGAVYGLGLLWVSLVTLPLMAGVQEICDRTALATGRGLGELAALKYPRRGRPIIAVLLGGLVIANALNIAADLVAVGSGMNLLHAGPTWVWALVSGVAITIFVVLGSFAQIARVFKYLCLALLAYFGVLFFINADWASVLHHLLIPHLSLDQEYIALLVAVLGTTISPYLFFWQSAHRVEEMREEPLGGDRAVPVTQLSTAAASTKLTTARVDVFGGMFLSNLVMFAIIVASAATLGGQQITSAAQAAKALEPVAGSAATVLFALGFIGTGTLAVPVLAGAGAAGMAGLLRRPWGFSRSPRKAPVFYGLVAVGTVGGTLLSLMDANPIQLLVIVAIINGVAAAPFLLLVLMVSSDHKLMGEFKNGRVATFFGWAAFLLMAVSALVLVFQGLHG